MIMYNMLIPIIQIFMYNGFRENFILLFFRLFYECFCKILFFLYIHYKKYCEFEKVHNKIR